ncbi:MAG: phage holin family protein [Oscillospiraceae bacterium]
MDINDFIKPELLVLVPVLMIIGQIIKRTKIKNNYIPLILGGASIVLCGFWVFSTCESGAAPNTLEDIMTGIFTAITQGILISGASVYAHQLVKQQISIEKPVRKLNS